MELAQWRTAWDDGILDFNQGRYWHAHESWERGWTKLPEPHKSWTKAMIQACGVFVHIEKERYAPALRLSLRAIELMAEAEAHATLHGVRPELRILGVDEVLLKIAAHLKVGAPDREWFLKLAHGLRAEREK